jgi:hypothetical protein
MIDHGIPERARDERAKQIGEWAAGAGYAAFLAAAVLLLAPANAAAQGAQPSIAVDSLQRESTHWKAIVKITNGTRRSFGLVGFRCAFFHQGRAVDSSGNVAVNIAAGETVFDKVIGPYSSQAVDNATCRISYANP